jgi:outer membrane protein TolC
LKKFIFLLLPALLFCDDLKSLLEFAKNSNNIITASKITKQSKLQEVEASKSDYYPTIDAGAFYQRYDEKNVFASGTTYGAFATLGVDIYDGGKKSNTLKQKENELSSSEYEYRDTFKSISLAIVEDFYNIRSFTSLLQSREEASKVLKAQLDRMQKFYEAKMATSDDVDRLQAAYDKNIYAIESLKFQILSLKKALELKVGKEIKQLDNSKFKKIDDKGDELDKIKALRASKNSILSASETIDSYYYPQIRVEDTYTFYGYEDEPSLGGRAIEQLDSQNKLMATLNLRVIDFGVMGEKKEALRLHAKALNEQILYKAKEQKMHIELAKERIKTAKLNIKSSKSALKASQSAFETITQKYNASIVDNVAYLDALSSKTDSQATYEKSLNDLELAYAIYYYYNAKDLGEYLK